MDTELKNLRHILNHDLRAPLRAIDGFSNIFELEYADQLNQAGKDIFEKIQTSSHRLDKRIQGLIDLTELNEHTINPVKLEVSQMAFLNSNWLEKNKFHLSNMTHISIYADKVLFETLMRNLLQNSVRFNHSEPNILLKTEIEKDYILLKISDDGVGIDPDLGDSIFDLYTFDPTLKAMHGEGIGLSLCREIMRKHDGYITYNKLKKNGAEFICAFKLKR